jgi:hypothetical protein
MAARGAASVAHVFRKARRAVDLEFGKLSSN